MRSSRPWKVSLVALVDSLLAQFIAEAAAGALRELRVFKVVSQGEVRQMLAVERDKARLSSTCDDSSRAQADQPVADETCTGLAAYFGDDPGKYDDCRSVSAPAPAPQVSFGPIPGGAMGALRLQV